MIGKRTTCIGEKAQSQKREGIRNCNRNIKNTRFPNSEKWAILKADKEIKHSWLCGRCKK